jgi:alcohol dehydrogenase class IV
MNFEFASASRIIFGPHTSRQIGVYVNRFGNSALLVCGRSQERAASTAEHLREQGVRVTIFRAEREPTIEMINRGASLAREAACSMVIAVGGGSVIDTGKAVAALSTNRGKLLDYLEVIGRGEPLANPPLHFVAVPTTAGTGSEVTKNAVIFSPEHRVKVSLRSSFMYPAVAVVDPELTLTLPPALTASTGLDAFTQLIEPFICNKPTPPTDAFCREGLARISRALPAAYQNGADARAREDMCMASLFSGIALANAKLGAVHGLAGPLGGMIDAPHGTICAALLPHVMAVNLKALRKRQPQSPALLRMAELGRIMGRAVQTGAWQSGAGQSGAASAGTAGGAPTGQASFAAASSAAFIAETNPTAAAAQADAAVEQIRSLCSRFALPSLGKLGFKKADFAAVIEKSRHSSSMKGNPLPLTDRELGSVLEAAF